MGAVGVEGQNTGEDVVFTYKYKLECDVVEPQGPCCYFVIYGLLGFMDDGSMLLSSGPYDEELTADCGRNDSAWNTITSIGFPFLSGILYEGHVMLIQRDCGTTIGRERIAEETEQYSVD